MIDGWTLDELNARGLVAEPGDGPKKVSSIDEHPSWKSDATGYRDEPLFPNCQMPPVYKTLDPRFLQAMEEIGLYGLEKYGDASFESQRKSGTLARMERTQPDMIFAHMGIHYLEYSRNQKHDHFGTLRHQLAAAAFNAMMEYVFAVEADGREL